jgi:hypothetical protein
MLIEEWQLILAAVSTLGWGVYVYFTIRTFREIKAQTDLQREAFLVVQVSKNPPSENALDREHANFKTAREKWKEIVQSNVPEAILPDRAIVLQLVNKGKCDISRCSISVEASIQPLMFLARKRNIKGEVLKWQVAVDPVDAMLAEDDTMEVIIARVGMFPHVAFTWTVEYEDIRGKKYSRFGGYRGTEDTNQMANPMHIQ